MSMVWVLSISTASSSSLSTSTYSPFFQLITARLLIALDHVAGLGVDHLLLQAVAGLLVDHVEVGLFDRRRGRIKRHRARDQGKLQRPFPISARGHYNLRLDGFRRIRELQLPLGVLVPGSRQAMPFELLQELNRVSEKSVHLSKEAGFRKDRRTQR